ncbi:hypothetical protein BdWA1_002700 [Babesia duncani]|uniref:Uncharacterized protein n=1 Tax=Babesia duncani TaxID=323732 RepID=A0AAD9PJP2_9APIC|nr:hypothetical protein BdWA1_002700 [Babesia duncani]
MSFMKLRFIFQNTRLQLNLLGSQFITGYIFFKTLQCFQVTKYEIGEPQLRHAVFKKLGVKVFNFHDGLWDKYKNGDNQSQGDLWKTNEMATYFTRIIKMPHLLSSKGNVNIKL